MRVIMRSLLAAAFLAGGTVGTASAEVSILEEMEKAFIQLHEQVGPCVVSIETKSAAGDAATQLEDWFRRFGMPAPEDSPQDRPRRVPPVRATGSGLIYDRDGHIVTNYHVIEQTDSITVKLRNGNEYDAVIVGTDPETDIAVIKIEAEEYLPVPRLGDSDALKVGQFAVAIGSPRGFEGSVSFGHISALGREDLAGLRAQGLTFQNLIQTDAAINLGNSGGPLCNINGGVIGINTAIIWGANSIGFAIPINTVTRTVPQLISAGRVSRGFLGVVIDDASLYADCVGIELPDDMGAFVKRTQRGAPADSAGIRPYDVIRKVNGEIVQSASDLQNRVSSFSPGTAVAVELWRDKHIVETEVTLEERRLAQVQPERERHILGMRLRSATSVILDRLGLSPDTGGVVITEIKAGSPAEDAHLAVGDVILEAARQPVANPGTFLALADEHGKPGSALTIRFIRDNEDPDITVIRVPLAR